VFPFFEAFFLHTNIRNHHKPFVSGSFQLLNDWEIPGLALYSS